MVYVLACYQVVMGLLSLSWRARKIDLGSLVTKARLDTRKESRDVMVAYVALTTSPIECTNMWLAPYTPIMHGKGALLLLLNILVTIVHNMRIIYF